ncbi:MAG: M20 family metallopeptidase [Desulfocapsaceae bacterium]|jgi:acetylornithine deacetylase/succinyl-diaminopimelate desuccinylase-like protein|nr:M20 family metallopeptidase [Desulfocapsaceae bacterium]
MSRENAIKNAEELFDSGAFFNLLAKRVAYQSESQEESQSAESQAYLSKEMVPYLEAWGFVCHILENPEMKRLPMLAAVRHEGDNLPTVLTYGHGDTVRAMTERWREGFTPWELKKDGERWYGRGSADNKGQHTINLCALEAVLKAKGSLGFNTKVLIEIGEEMGSPGLHAVCARHKELLSADVLIGSDGPRIEPGKPTIFGGSRGVINFDLEVNLRDGGHHSGNWGGLLANPGVILANAISSLIDQNGVIQVAGLKPSEIPASVRNVLAELEVTGEGGPALDLDWGEPGLTPAEKVYGYSTLEVLAFTCGNPAAPAHAIPDKAAARIHMRFTRDLDSSTFQQIIRKHLDDKGFGKVKLHTVAEGSMQATRLDPGNPWSKWAVASITRSMGRPPAVLPNLGGSLPNDAFTDILGLPTVWVPHSYGGCSQHAPDEHVLESIMRQGLQIMAGLFWDLGEQGLPAE